MHHWQGKFVIFLLSIFAGWSNAEAVKSTPACTGLVLAEYYDKCEHSSHGPVFILDYSRHCPKEFACRAPGHPRETVSGRSYWFDQKQVEKRKGPRESNFKCDQLANKKRRAEARKKALEALSLDNNLRRQRDSKIVDSVELNVVQERVSNYRPTERKKVKGKRVRILVEYREYHCRIDVKVTLAKKMASAECLPDPNAAMCRHESHGFDHFRKKRSPVCGHYNMKYLVKDSPKNEDFEHRGEVYRPICSTCNEITDRNEKVSCLKKNLEKIERRSAASQEYFAENEDARSEGIILSREEIVLNRLLMLSYLTVHEPIAPNVSEFQIGLSEAQSQAVIPATPKGAYYWATENSFDGLVQAMEKYHLSKEDREEILQEAFANRNFNRLEFGLIDFLANEKAQRLKFATKDSLSSLKVALNQAEDEGDRLVILKAALAVYQEFMVQQKIRISQIQALLAQYRLGRGDDLQIPVERVLELVSNEGLKGRIEDIYLENTGDSQFFRDSAVNFLGVQVRNTKREMEIAEKILVEMHEEIKDLPLGKVFAVHISLLKLDLNSFSDNLAIAKKAVREMITPEMAVEAMRQLVALANYTKGQLQEQIEILSDYSRKRESGFKRLEKLLAEIVSSPIKGSSLEALEAILMGLPNSASIALSVQEELRLLLEESVENDLKILETEIARLETFEVELMNQK